MGMTGEIRRLFEPVDPRFLQLRIARIDAEMERAAEEGRFTDARRLAAWQEHLLDCLMYGGTTLERAFDT